MDLKVTGGELVTRADDGEVDALISSYNMLPNHVLILSRHLLLTFVNDLYHKMINKQL